LGFAPAQHKSYPFTDAVPSAILSQSTIAPLSFATFYRAQDDDCYEENHEILHLTYSCPGKTLGTPTKLQITTFVAPLTVSGDDLEDVIKSFGDDTTKFRLLFRQQQEFADKGLVFVSDFTWTAFGNSEPHGLARTNRQG
jgi:hypothetical protein